MSEDVDYRFHAGRLLENPALRKALEDERASILREISQLPRTDVEGRHLATVALDLVDNLERRWRNMVDTGRIEQFHAEMRTKVA